MPRARDIGTFGDDAPPAGASPWVVEPVVAPIAVDEYDPVWPAHYEALAARIAEALGARALALQHVGSTSVQGLAAKPVIDMDLIVAEPAAEDAWLPALEAAGFILTVREPWWYEHRCLRFEPDGRAQADERLPGAAPGTEVPAGSAGAGTMRANLHVFGPDSPEPWRHRIFRDHLRRNRADRDLYAAAKLAAARSSNAAGEVVMEYNARKESVLREIYARAFAAAGL
ncbi:GrpB family protein [Brevibacterium moorei]|uniref:GrpB family protein n=1 Tax=Brevibacterium moorei TaxID=2968457 RepID=UPI00211C6BF0|nr:GrpB family protein [Brevibacterium sp. 68QC2CO]MCQ9385776.1 GrpB family protein [Brevibacterium sp. 68QC2CO]